MLGNTESLLIIRDVNDATLLEVNPMQRDIPAISPSANNLPPLEIISPRVSCDDYPKDYFPVTSQPER